MPAIRRLCVFCGSSTGEDHAIRRTTADLGRLLVAEGIELVYGGGAVGLMGLVADTVLDGGGTVVGVIPLNLFEKEVAHPGCTELVEVDSMHQRKALMYQRSDAFAALPGGFGTLEELAEILTWSQLGLQPKPIGVLNVGGFFDPLLAQLDRMVEVGFLKPSNRALLVSRDTPDALLEALRTYEAVSEAKWIGLEQT